MLKAAKKSAGPTIKERVAELESELKLLRKLVREVGENSILRREGEIEALIGYLGSITPTCLKTKAPSWLKEIRLLKIKPHKGRLKDMKEIDRILAFLLDGIIDATQLKSPAPKRISAKKTAPATTPKSQRCKGKS